MAADPQQRVCTECDESFEWTGAGRPPMACSLACRNARKGRQKREWLARGGTTEKVIRRGVRNNYKNSDGYVHIGDTKRLQHRVVMEQMLGRPLEKFENVHHINGVRDDNRPENLELWVTSQPPGRRVSDQIEWYVEHYPEYVAAALAGRRQLRLVI